MKATILALSFIAAISFGTMSALAAHEGHNHDVSSATPPVAQKYTCPMHPEVISDKPGNCPKCGMKLVPVKDSAAPKK